MQAGIIDVTKVVRIALENAASVAGRLLLAQATMTELKEPSQTGNRHSTPHDAAHRRVTILRGPLPVSNVQCSNWHGRAFLFLVLLFAAPPNPLLLNDLEQSPSRYAGCTKASRK
jgi:hypothetical protein